MTSPFRHHIHQTKTYIYTNSQILDKIIKLQK